MNDDNKRIGEVRESLFQISFEKNPNVRVLVLVLFEL